jgi:hypothetical protein
MLLELLDRLSSDLQPPDVFNTLSVRMGFAATASPPSAFSLCRSVLRWVALPRVTSQRARHQPRASAARKRTTGGGHLLPRTGKTDFGLRVLEQDGESQPVLLVSGAEQYSYPPFVVGEGARTRGCGLPKYTRKVVSGLQMLMKDFTHPPIN